MSGRKGVKHNTLFIIFLTILISTFIISLINLLANASDSTIRNNKYIIEDVNVDFDKMKQYDANINKFNIYNNGREPEVTSKGINDMLLYAKEQGYNKIIMPKGEYSISENNPIIMVSDMILDLNGSIFKINTNGLQNYTVINFTKCQNSKIINGVIEGDRYTHDYETIKGSHEWTCGVVFDDSENCELENVTIKSFPGYGLSSSLGKNISNLIIGVTKDNLQKGNINDKGEENSKNGTIRTIKPMNISEVGGAFELGYNKGYMGYPFMQAKEFDSYFYDKDMNFISKIEECKQYKKVTIPKEAFFVNFVFNQENIPTKADTDFNSTTVFLTNYKSPYKIKISNCIIENNRSLGIGLCGGRNFIIENNTFYKNGGGAPGYAVDLEDGWEYMDGYLFKNNKFVENNNDIVVCAGDNIIFEGNEFSSTVYMWGRATNYKFISNKFENINMSINYEYSTDTVCQDNTYINSKIAIYSKNEVANIIIRNEKFIDTSINVMPENVTITDSEIIATEGSSIGIFGSYHNSNFKLSTGGLDSVKLNYCTISDGVINVQGKSYLINCTITNSTFNSSNKTENIEISNCDIKNSKLSVSTWGNSFKANIFNNDILMLEGKNSFIDISAGKMAELTFKGNTVKNILDVPVFKLYDTSYSIPNGKVNISNNTFTQENYEYVFDGVDIKSGKFKFNIKDNEVSGAKIINNKYK